MFLPLIVLAGGIFVTAVVLLKRSLDLRYGSIELIRWHIGFVGLYLGGGGLWALLTMSEDSFVWATTYYEITLSGILLAAVAWALVLGAAHLCIRWMPCVVHVRNCMMSAEQNTGLRSGMLAFGLLVTLGLLAGYVTGNLGYMGQKVGDDGSAYRINPFYDFILTLYPAVAAWFASHIFARKLALVPAATGAILLALGIPLGRRVFLAAGLAAMALSYCRDPQITLRRSATLFLLLALAYSGLGVFFNLRQAEEAKFGRAIDSRVELLALLPEALALTFSEPDAATKELNSLRKENESRRPFFTLGFLIYCAKGYGSNLASMGMLTLSSILVAVPSIIFPNKDDFLDDYQEEERFVERDFGIPLTLDESPTLPSSGLINFGLLGVAIQTFLFAVTIFLCLRLLGPVAATPFAVFGIVYLIVSLQLAEIGSASLFVRLRLILILCGLGWLWATALGPHSRTPKGRMVTPA
jgi:hypothetical protein